MRIKDISLPIGPDLLTWPGDPSVAVVPATRIARGDSANVSQIGMGTHTGTHIDPPFHFLDDGSKADQLDLDVLYGDAFVADLRTCEEEISPQDLKGIELPAGTTRILFRTTNSDLWRSLPMEFPADYVALSPEGAQWVIDQGIRLVGIDFLSIEKRGAPGHPTHTTLLLAGVVIVEGLDLSDVQPGVYTLACLPLKIVDGDGAPARAILIEA